jgi:hypothetical protein
MQLLGKQASLVQLRVGAPFFDSSITSQSSQRSSRFHKPAVSRAALETATIWPPCGSLQASFVRKSRRGSTGRGLHFFCSCSSIIRAQPSEG